MEAPSHLAPSDQSAVPESPAATSGPAANDCRRFSLSAAQARHYLVHAGAISANDRHYIASDSPCIAQGTVQTQAGAVLHWRIGELREGELRGPDGHIMHLYCSRCPSPPFF
jgi:hypothetical protein